MKIIDVSGHNGTIDWNKVRASGVDGVIIRAGYGRLVSQKDKLFENNYEGASAAGLHIGAYWYSYAEDPEEAGTEARAFLETIKGKKFDLPVYFDIEEQKHISLGRTMCTAISEAFCSEVENAGYFCGIYSFDSFFATNLSADIPDRYSCWAARVDGKRPQYCASYGMWQYSWKESVNGIAGNVDVSECYKDFPEIIRNAGLNGFKNSDTYTVKAKICGIPSSNAGTIKSACESMGMTVKQEKEAVL